MKTMIDVMMDELTRGMYRSHSVDVYKPTLVVGLGGTGLKILRSLKRELLKHDKQNIRLLGIDADTGENTIIPELPPLDADAGELALLNADIAVRALTRAEEGQEGSRHILEYLPVRHDAVGAVHQDVRNKIAANKGAGQFRRAGRLIFSCNVTGGTALDQRIIDIHTALNGMRRRRDQVAQGAQIDEGSQVFVVSSVAGGTGAGCLIDMLGLLRKTFNGPQDKITVIALLPGKSLDRELSVPAEEKINTRGNALALLKELEQFMLGERSDYTFQFSEHLRYRPGTRTIADSVYLLGDIQYNNARIDRWLDLCQAASYFLYAIIGTGMGTTKAAGDINYSPTAASARKTKPAIFSTLGIGVLEYPIAELGSFALRSAMHDLLSRWLDEKVAKGDIDKSIKSLKTTLKVHSLGDLVASFNFNPSTVAQARYLTAAAEKKLALGKDDDWFVGKAMAMMENIDGQLAGYDGLLSRHSGVLLEAYTAGVSTAARTMMTGNQVVALEAMRGLVAHLKTLRDELMEDAEARIKATSLSLKGIEHLKRRIHKIDVLWLDRPFRRRLIEEVNAYLKLRLDAHLEGPVSYLLGEMIRMANDTLNIMEGVHAELKNMHLANQEQSALAGSTEHAPAFVQFIMNRDQMKDWVSTIELPANQNFTARVLNADLMVREALGGCEEAIEQAFARLGIATDVRKRSEEAGALKKMLLALGQSSVPLMHLVESAPDVEAMRPRGYVAGLQAAELIGLVTGSKDRAAAVNIENPHMVMYVRTLHEFALADWSEYEHARSCYQHNPWYYHIQDVTDAGAKS